MCRTLAQPKLLLCSWLAYLGTLLCLGSCSGAEASGTRLRVSAAASLQQVARELASAFEAESGIAVRINCAGSHALAQQIEAAGGSDVFLSADEDWIQYLEEKHCLVEGSARAFLSNRLVFVAHGKRSEPAPALEELPSASFDYLAIGHPESVPAGRYAKRFLESIETPEGSLWERLQGRLAPCMDVRAALAMAESHTEILALVYASEAQRSTSVQAYLEIPGHLQPEIRYSAALVRDRNRRDSSDAGDPRARRFLDFLFTPQAEAIYAAHGFGLPAPQQGSQR